MSLRLDVSGNYMLESVNYITCINPMVHPDRILPYHDFLYIIDGDWEIWEEENVYSLHSDDLLILEAGKHHYGLKPCSPGNRHMYIHAAGGMGVEGSTLKEFKSLIHCQNNSRVKQLFEEILSVMWSEDELKDMKLELLFKLFLCEILKQQEQTDRSKVNIVEQAVSLMQTTPQTFFTSTEMADKFFVCERTLNNLFRKTYNMTFSGYQMDRKLEMVRQYLQMHPESKLDEAAKNFGFCDEFHLGKAYKKKYGVSPKRHIKEQGI